jgi:hypothetical protein
VKKGRKRFVWKNIDWRLRWCSRRLKRFFPAQPSGRRALSHSDLAAPRNTPGARAAPLYREFGNGSVVLRLAPTHYSPWIDDHSPRAPPSSNVRNRPAYDIRNTNVKKGRKRFVWKKIDLRLRCCARCGFETRAALRAQSAEPLRPSSTPQHPWGQGGAPLPGIRKFPHFSPSPPAEEKKSPPPAVCRSSTAVLNTSCSQHTRSYFCRAWGLGRGAFRKKMAVFAEPQEAAGASRWNARSKKTALEVMGGKLRGRPW